MENSRHDPSEYVRGIQQILISDKKRIGFLFGAGTSMAKKSDQSLTVPGVIQMTSDILEEVKSEFSDLGDALSEMMEELNNSEKTIEHLLSSIEQKSKIIGSGRLNNLDKNGFERLSKVIKNKVRSKVSVHKVEDAVVGEEIIDDLIQTDFAEWIGQAERRFPIEIFTFNYDYLFELGLERKRIPYYDGFSGSFRPFFNSESVEDHSFLPNQTKVWKIHGSLGWHYDPKSDRIIRTPPDEEDILIYPSILKYQDSKKQPYESLMDRLSNFLKQDDSILFTSGYSWGDEHINDRIISALKTNTTSHVIALYHDKTRGEDGVFNYSLTPESGMGKIGIENMKISVYGYRSAIIGCRYGEWTLGSEPDKDDTPQINQYFDEDAPTMSVGEGEKIGKEIWSGKGEFFLPDFSKLVSFLKSLINENEIGTLGRNARK